MSRYRWLKPSKCIEDMYFYPATKALSYDESEKLLFEAVERGDIKVLLNDEVVPKAHISVYLNLYARAHKDQSPHTLAPDLRLSYDDLRAVFDRPVIDNRKRGRPVQEDSRWSEDRALTSEMHRMMAAPPGHTQAKSAAEAARILVKAGRVSGAGTPESLAKRLERKFRKYYSS